MTPQAIVDTYEKMVNDNKIKWIDVDHSVLPKSTSEYCKMWLDFFGVKYQVATLQLEGTYLFKIEDDTVKFLHHDSRRETHMWADDGFHSYIDNNVALAKLSARIGLSESAVKQMFDTIDTTIGNAPNN